MNQAGSENKCSKRVSNECILNKYNIDDVSNDQNEICDCKQRGWSACWKHSSDVGLFFNMEYVVGVAEVNSSPANSQQQEQTTINSSCQQSLIKKVWVHLQSIVAAHMNSCPRCNPKPPCRRVADSISQNSILSFLSSETSPPRLSSNQSCQSYKTSCHRARSPCLSNRTSCLSARSFCPQASSTFQRDRSSFSKVLPPRPNLTPPCSHLKTTDPISNPPDQKLIEIGRNAKPSFQFTKCPHAELSTWDNPICSHTKCLHFNPSDENVKYLNAKLSCSNAECPDVKPTNLNPEWLCGRHANTPKPYCPNVECSHAKPLTLNAKTSCPINECPNAKLSNIKSEWQNAKPSYPIAEWPNTKPSWQNADSPNVKPSCPNGECSIGKPTCPNPECPNVKPTCPIPECPNVKPTCPNVACPNVKPTCPNPKCPNVIPTCPIPECPNVKPTCPNPECPNVKPTCPIPECPNVKPTCPIPECPNVKPTCPNSERLNGKPKCPNPECPHVKPTCPNVACPNAKPKCPNPECPNVKPSSFKSELPNTNSTCPNPECPNVKPTRPNSECPNVKPTCPNTEWPNFKPSFLKAEWSNTKSACSNAECSNIKLSSLKTEGPNMYSSRANADCPNAKPFCPNSVPVCPHAKTKLYHSFSNDSLTSNCKEDLVELAKAYLQKITSSHKMRCPRCSKQTTSPSHIETVTTYLRNMMEQAWSYLNSDTSSKKCCHSQCVLSNYSHTAIKSPCRINSRCCCGTSRQKCQKTQPFESICFSKTNICPNKASTCPGAVISPPFLNPTTCAKPVTCPKNFECQDTISPACKSEEQGTHEHKSCHTPCCKRNSRGVQPSFNISETSVWSLNSETRTRHVKPPQSVEELKASITGLEPSGNLLGCEIMDFRSTIKFSKPCEQDIKVSTDKPTPCLGLTMEQKDQRYDPQFKDSKHSKECLDNCKKTTSLCVDPEEASCKEEAGGLLKSDAHYEALLDEQFGNMPRKQMRINDLNSKAGHKSITCVENIQPDRKDCNSQEKEALGKVPHDYRYYY